MVFICFHVQFWWFLFMFFLMVFSLSDKFWGQQHLRLHHGGPGVQLGTIEAQSPSLTWKIHENPSIFGSDIFGVLLMFVYFGVFVGRFWCFWLTFWSCSGCVLAKNISLWDFCLLRPLLAFLLSENVSRLGRDASLVLKEPPDGPELLQTHATDHRWRIGFILAKKKNCMAMLHRTEMYLT